MKAMEPGAPMISVPAGVLKEYIAPSSSRTPTPPPPSPPAATMTNSTSTSKSNSATSVAVSSKSRTPSPLRTLSSDSITIVSASSSTVSSGSVSLVPASAAITSGSITVVSATSSTISSGSVSVVPATTLPSSITIVPASSTPISSNLLASSTPVSSSSLTGVSSSVSLSSSSITIAAASTSIASSSVSIVPATNTSNSVSLVSAASGIASSSVSLVSAASGIASSSVSLVPAASGIASSSVSLVPAANAIASSSVSLVPASNAVASNSVSLKPASIAVTTNSLKTSVASGSVSVVAAMNTIASSSVSVVPASSAIASSSVTVVPASTPGSSGSVSDSSSDSSSGSDSGSNKLRTLPAGVSIKPLTPVSSQVPTCLTNGDVTIKEKMSVEKSEVDESAKDEKIEIDDKNEVKNSVGETQQQNCATTGVKRNSEDELKSKPDLKKIRVFAPSADDAMKRDVDLAVKEFNQRLDEVSKKSKKNCESDINKSVVNNTVSGPSVEERTSVNHISPSTPDSALCPPVASHLLTNTQGNSFSGSVSIKQSVNSQGSTHSAVTYSKDVQMVHQDPTPISSAPPPVPVPAPMPIEREVLIPVREGTSFVHVQRDMTSMTTSLQRDMPPVMPPVIPLVQRDSNNMNTVDEITIVDKENKSTRRKLQKLPRKELENMILRLLSEKLLHQSDLGRMKQLQEKLETTLETNRKKTAQFHKEVEDLRKVTNRLASEHAARKGQYVTPIRIKRSVGIQAAPHIINKGIMHANGNTSAIKTISPRSSSVGGVSSTPSPVKPNVGGSHPRTHNPSPHIPYHNKVMANSATGGTVGLIGASQQNPRSQNVGNISASSVLTSMAASAAGIGTVRPGTGQIMMMTQGNMMQTLPRNTVSGGRLTSNRPSPIGASPGTLVKVPASSTPQLVAIPPSGGQVVLLPPSSTGQPATALMVTQVSTGVHSGSSASNPAVVQSRIGGGSVGSSQGSSSKVMNSILNTATTTTMSSAHGPQHRHPAPLPRTPYQQMGGLTKRLPPQPTLKLSHKDNSIVLSWTMGKTEDHEAIASYQLYAYQEGTAPPSAQLWKKVGSVKALELPMACTLTQFMPGHIYHFAVRAVDIKSRLGPFSDPRSIRLDK